MKRFNAVVRMVTVGVLMGLAGSATAQQAYPSKAIRMIVPYSPGGPTDVVARLLGPHLTQRLGQPIVVDNRPGGNTIIGTEALAKSPPDGYTIMTMAIAHTIIPSLLATPYDPIKDFAPVATVVSGELVLVLHPSVPANTLQELIALAKSKPGELNYASASTGGPLHLAGELLNMMTGIKTQHIPYKGAAPALADVVAGQVQMLFSPPDTAIPHIKAGKLKAIAISGATRLSALPQVPTFTEAGLPGFNVKNWFGVLAPAGTPKPIIDRLSSEIAKILAVPEIREKLVRLGMEPFISTPEQFAALIRSDFAQYAKVIKQANIKLE